MSLVGESKCHGCLKSIRGCVLPDEAPAGGSTSLETALGPRQSALAKPTARRNLSEHKVIDDTYFINSRPTQTRCLWIPGTPSLANIPNKFPRRVNPTNNSKPPPPPSRSADTATGATSQLFASRQ